MFTQGAYTILEGMADSNNDMVCVQLDGELARSVEVDVHFEEGSATMGDFSNSDLTFTFSQSAVMQCFLLQTSADGLFETDETFRISLSSPSDVIEVSNGVVDVTIQDSSELTVGFVMSAYDVMEGDTLMVCVLVLSGGLADDVSLMVNVVIEDQEGIYQGELTGQGYVVLPHISLVR